MYMYVQCIHEYTMQQVVVIGVGEGGGGGLQGLKFVIITDNGFCSAGHGCPAFRFVVDWCW
jgi:hypothetical protein